MYIEADLYIGGTEHRRFDNLLNLNFTASVDIFWQGLPIDMFTVDIVYGSNLPFTVGNNIKLFNDNDVLFADFYIKTSSLKAKNIVHIEAMSAMGLLDVITVSERNGYSGEQVEGTYYDSPEMLKYYLDGLLLHRKDVTSTFYKAINYSFRKPQFGFDRFGVILPEQTGRERLSYYLYAGRKVVRQSFCEGLIIDDYMPMWRYGDESEFAPTITVIPYEKVYLIPSVETTDIIVSMTVYQYYMRDIPPSGTSNYQTAIDTDDGRTWYFWSNNYKYTNPNPTDIILSSGKNVVFRDIKVSNTPYLSNPAEELGVKLMPYTLKITAGVINNGEYKPGDTVQIYVDEKTIYQGIIINAVFEFGTQTKSQLIIMAKSVPIETYHIKFRHRYIYTDENGNEKYVSLGEKTYYFPKDYVYTVTHPDITLDVVGDVIELEPYTRTTTRTATENQNWFIKYRKKTNQEESNNEDQ